MDNPNIQIVCFDVCGQLFGVDVAWVSDVHKLDRLTPVPKAPQIVAGVLNLRGRIVLALNLGEFLGCGASENSTRLMINTQFLNESYGFLVDNVSDVVSLNAAHLQPCPQNFDPKLVGFAQGTMRYKGRLMTILKVDSMIESMLSCDLLHCA